MIIDIEKSIIHKTKGKFIAVIALVIIICLLLFIPFRNDLFKGLDNSILGIFFAVAYIIYTVYESFRNYHYIYYNDESDKIVLRYFAPTLFTSKKNVIEIPKKEFAGYKLNSLFMRYRETITLFRNSGKGVAKYPEVSLTALSATERESLFRSLNALRNKNAKQ
jgi:hypothetical protein